MLVYQNYFVENELSSKNFLSIKLNSLRLERSLHELLTIIFDIEPADLKSSSEPVIEFTPNSLKLENVFDKTWLLNDYNLSKFKRSASITEKY